MNFTTYQSEICRPIQVQKLLLDHWMKRICQQCEHWLLLFSTKQLVVITTKVKSEKQNSSCQGCIHRRFKYFIYIFVCFFYFNATDLSWTKSEVISREVSTRFRLKKQWLRPKEILLSTNVKFNSPLQYFCWYFPNSFRLTIKAKLSKKHVKF